MTYLQEMTKLLNASTTNRNMIDSFLDEYCELLERKTTATFGVSQASFIADAFYNKFIDRFDRSHRQTQHTESLLEALADMFVAFIENNPYDSRSQGCHELADLLQFDFEEMRFPL